MPYERAAPCADYCEAEWTACRAVTLYRAPRHSARPAVRVPAGTPVRVAGGLSRTARPGIVVFRAPMRYAARRFTEHAGGGTLGVDSTARTFQASDTLYLVDRISDGDGTVEYRWFYRGRYERGVPFWAESPGEANPPALIVREPEQVWWVRILVPGAPSGWVAFDRDDWAGVAPKYDDPAESCAK